MAVLQKLRGEPKYTLLLMQGEEMISRQQNIYPREGESTVRETELMMKMLQAVNKTAVQWHQEMK